MRSGRESISWGSLGRKHIVLHILSLGICTLINTAENSIILALLILFVCFLQITAKWNRTFRLWRCCIYLKTDISTAEKLQPFSTVCFKTLVPILCPLAASCTVIYSWCNPIRNWKENVFVIFLWWRIQLKRSYFLNRNVFKLTKLCSDIKNIVSV